MTLYYIPIIVLFAPLLQNGRKRVWPYLLFLISAVLIIALSPVWQETQLIPTQYSISFLSLWLLLFLFLLVRPKLDNQWILPAVMLNAFALAAMLTDFSLPIDMFLEKNDNSIYSALISIVVGVILFGAFARVMGVLFSNSKSAEQFSSLCYAIGASILFPSLLGEMTIDSYSVSATAIFFPLIVTFFNAQLLSAASSIRWYLSLPFVILIFGLEIFLATEILGAYILKG